MRIAEKTNYRAKPGMSGGRALPAAIRPYARKVNGEPLAMSFDLETRTFEFSFRPFGGDGSGAAGAAGANTVPDLPTEFFIPRYQYPRGVAVAVSTGHFEYEPRHQVLRFWHRGKGDQTVRIRDERKAPESY